MSGQRPRHEIEKLLGGYATGTLTAEERQALFEAALGNQVLFDTLANEQALKELLEDPASRAHLLAVLGDERRSPLARLAAWLRRPSVLALSGAVAAGIILITVMQPGRQQKPAPALVATSEPAPSAPAVAPAPTPAGKGTHEKSAEPAPERKPQRQAEAQMTQKSEPVAMPATAYIPPPPRLSPQAPAPAQFLSSSAPAQTPPPASSTRAAEADVQVQTQVADAMSTQVERAAVRPEMRKAAQVAGARDLYYTSQPQTVSARGFTSRQPANKAKASGNLSPGVAGGAAQRAPGIRYSILESLADGSREVDPSAPIGVGNSVRVRFEANQEGELAVMRLESNGTWTLWGSAHVRVGEPVYMPAESFVTMAAPGQLRFFVKFTRAPQVEARLDQLKPTLGVLHEQAGNSVYVVNPIRSAESAVEFEFAITAK